MSLHLFVSGRLCLFGEHSDWAGKYRTMNATIVPGKALVTGIDQGIEAYVEKSDKFVMTSEAPEIANIWNDFSCDMDADALKIVAHSDSFFSYSAGVASYMLEWYKVGGVKINIVRMTLPLKSGLSSSAAICVLVCRSFNLLYNLHLNTIGEMNIAYLGEQRTASRCGRLDQACAFGIRPVCMTFDGDEIDVQPIIVKAPLHWVFADLNAKKDTIRILSDLNKAYPFPSDEKERREHLALGEKNDIIVSRAIDYIKNGEVEKLGNLMKEAQLLFDKEIAPLCPTELKAPILHSVLDDDYIQSLSYGGKGVGSQGDGSVQFLAKDVKCQKKIIDYLSSKNMRAFSLTIKPQFSVRKAIIPVAGFGTRLFPMTKAIKKEFLPIVDQDGIVKPVILILLEELISSGIEEICIVLGSEKERNDYRSFFENHLPDDHYSKLNNHSKQYEKRILEIGKKIVYVYQKEKHGFGHAVYQAANFAGQDPVLLLLGDTIYRSQTTKTCCLQLIEAFEELNKPMVAVHQISLEEVSRYGIVSGSWENKEKTIMNITQIEEKPTVSYAYNHLRMSSEDNNDNYYSVFGQYILTKEVFQQLRKDIELSDNEDNEIELTYALDSVRKKTGMYGVVLNGKMYDTGNPESLKHTMKSFS